MSQDVVPRVSSSTPDAKVPAPKIAHLSPEERDARGRAARNKVPRAGHGGWEPAADRPDPIELLEEQARSRVPELVPIRYGRMLLSPFTFYRGAALIMAADLAGTPRSGLTAQFCGDAHLSNFGVFASPERQLMFDINDFDETLPGPWEWDVKRLAASFEVGRPRSRVHTPGAAGDRARRGRGVPRADEADRADAQPGRLVRPHRDGAAARGSCAELRPPRSASRPSRTSRRRARRDSMQAFAKLTHEVDGRARGSSPTRP